MPRARRHFLPGYPRHITHRCHKKEFLLKFARDRPNWKDWLHEARNRYGLSVLNYVVTSNHIHLLVVDRRSEAISKSMQLVSGRTAQAFHPRKKRSETFREDRYHATAVETDRHLIRCLTYIDLNMVPAGVAAYPSEWDVGGYAEMIAGRKGASITDYGALMELLNIESIETLRPLRKNRAGEALARGRMRRDGKWAESVAVGSKGFADTVKAKLGLRARGRRIFGIAGDCALREPQELLGVES